VRHALIHKRAVLIDHFIDAYKTARRRRSFPHKAVACIILLIFPGSAFSGRGAWKTVHKVSSRERDLVLKTSNPRRLYDDWRAYSRLPPTLRNRYFAKIYWKTKYCLLQKYGKPGRVPPERLSKLKAVAQRHGLTDVRDSNIRMVDGIFKIVDASPAKKHRRR